MILQKLKQIKSYCSKHEHCDNCVYWKKVDENFGECIINDAICELKTRPRSWDLDKFKEILDGVS